MYLNSTEKKASKITN